MRRIRSGKRFRALSANFHRRTDPGRSPTTLPKPGDADLLRCNIQVFRRKSRAIANFLCFLQKNVNGHRNGRVSGSDSSESCVTKPKRKIAMSKIIAALVASLFAASAFAAAAPSASASASAMASAPAASASASASAKVKKHKAKKAASASAAASAASAVPATPATPAKPAGK